MIGAEPSGLNSDRCAGRCTGPEGLLGLAAGDAVGFPALYHRMIAMPDRVLWLWSQAAGLMESRSTACRLAVYFGAPDALFLCGTDDTEFGSSGCAHPAEAGQRADRGGVVCRVVPPRRRCQR